MKRFFINAVLPSAFYIDAGFVEPYYLWLIPIVISYCENKSIRCVIFERFPACISDARIRKLFTEAGISYREESSLPLSSLFLSKKSPISIFFSLLAYPLSPLVSRSSLLNKSLPWWIIQLYHAVWDLSILDLRNSSSICPSKIQIRRNTCTVLRFLSKAIYLLCFGCKAASLSHSVYQYRALKVGFSFNPNFDCLFQAYGSLYRNQKLVDFSALVRPTTTWLHLFAQQNDKLFHPFVRDRLRGISVNAETQPELSPNESQSASNCIDPNQIFLHVFRDSPFNLIDRNRIFADYFDWVTFTLRILAQSQEYWSIRVHPSSARWGEDASGTLHQLARMAGFPILPDNIRINSSYPNISVFNNARRVVTYSGNCALEAAAFGIKSVCISMNSALSFGDQLLAFQPKSLNDYSELLLSDSQHPQFTLSQYAINSAHRLLYACENQLTIQRKINLPHVFRGDDADSINKIYDQLYESIYAENNSPQLSSLCEYAQSLF